MAKRLALITGGMGGLGEIISTKMSDAGYRVAVTHSPSFAPIPATSPTSSRASHAWAV